MKIFKKKSTQKVSSGEAAVFSASRSHDVYEPFDSSMEHWEKELYDRLRFTVPVIDAAISKIVRLTGGYKIQCRDESMQEIMDSFSGEIPVGLTGHSIQSFTDSFLESLLTYGNAVGEMLVDSETMQLTALYNGDPSKIAVLPGNSPELPVYCIKNSDGKLKTIEKPQLILLSALNPPPKNYGHINSQRTSGFKFRTYENIPMYRSELRTCRKRQIRRNLQAYRRHIRKGVYQRPCHADC